MSAPYSGATPHRTVEYPSPNR
uniref:DUF742 domain-containing protein n=1 Tax=Mesocestoides corti TaxID=53468 RepID=A0A5K3FZ54_MESCO